MVFVSPDSLHQVVLQDLDHVLTHRQAPAVGTATETLTQGQGHPAELHVGLPATAAIAACITHESGARAGGGPPAL